MLRKFSVFKLYYFLFILLLIPFTGEAKVIQCLKNIFRQPLLCRDLILNEDVGCFNLYNWNGLSVDNREILLKLAKRKIKDDLYPTLELDLRNQHYLLKKYPGFEIETFWEIKNNELNFFINRIIYQDVTIGETTPGLGKKFGLILQSIFSSIDWLTQNHQNVNKVNVISFNVINNKLKSMLIEFGFNSVNNEDAPSQPRFGDFHPQFDENAISNAITYFGDYGEHYFLILEKPKPL